MMLLIYQSKGSKVYNINMSTSSHMPLVLFDYLNNFSFQSTIINNYVLNTMAWFFKALLSYPGLAPICHDVSV